MRISAAALALALGELALSSAALAQSEPTDADGGAAEESAPFVIEIIDGEGPAPAEAPAPAPAPSPAASSPTCDPSREMSPPPPIASRSDLSGSRRHPIRGAHAARAKSTVALSFIPFLAAGVVSAGVIGLAALLQQDLDLSWDHGAGDPEDERIQEEEDDEESRTAARRASLVVVPITGLIAAPIFSAMLQSAHRREPRDLTVFGATFLGSTLGLTLDVGLACILYFATNSAAAVVATSLVGLVMLPPIGGAIGAHVALRSRRSPRFSFLPPVPTAIAAANGGAAPGLALAGIF